MVRCNWSHVRNAIQKLKLIIYNMKEYEFNLFLSLECCRNAQSNSSLTLVTNLFCLLRPSFNLLDSPLQEVCILIYESMKKPKFISLSIFYGRGVVIFVEHIG